MTTRQPSQITFIVGGWWGGCHSSGLTGISGGARQTRRSQISLLSLAAKCRDLELLSFCQAPSSNSPTLVYRARARTPSRQHDGWRAEKRGKSLVWSSPGGPFVFYTRTEAAFQKCRRRSRRYSRKRRRWQLHAREFDVDLSVYEPLPGLDDVVFCLVHYFVIVLVLSYNFQNKPRERTPPNGFQHKLTAEEQHCQAAALVSGSSDQSNMILICVPFVHLLFNIKPKAKIKSQQIFSKSLSITGSSRWTYLLLSASASYLVWKK